MVSKHIGIVGCSAEGAALCYRTICLESAQSMGEHFHPEISMHTHSLGEYMINIRSADWPAIAEMMLSSTKKLQAAGADFVICPDNTIHEAYPLVEKKSPIPWLHIGQVVADKAQENGFKDLAILGTKYLMEGPVYPEVLKKSDMRFKIPEKADRENINRIIFSELVEGIFSEDSRLYFNRVIQKLKNSGCEAVVLGCTEIPLLVRADDCPLPTLDSTRLLARAAIKYSLA